ncbi:hypothetical protein AB0C31_41100, partial [Actinoplanes philippinensis]
MCTPKRCHTAQEGYGFGLGALAISVVLLAGIVCSIVTSLSTARLADRLGYRARVVAAFAVIAAGFTGTTP